MQLACTEADLILHITEKKSVTRNFLATHIIMKPLLENTPPIKCLLTSYSARNKHKFGSNQRYRRCCLNCQ